MCLSDYPVIVILPGATFVLTLAIVKLVSTCEILNPFSAFSFSDIGHTNNLRYGYLLVNSFFRVSTFLLPVTLIPSAIIFVF